jgi:peptidoglycan/LPS O-acetylase OafA/YrhL
MAVLLHKHDRITQQVAGDFYFRRARRILPVYLCIIVLSILSVIVVLCRFDYGQVLEDLKPALCFWSNMAVLFTKDDYFKQVSF